MPPYSIPRRPFPSQNEEPIRVNWRRGMFRVWVLISVAWLMGWIIHLTMFGLQGGFKVIGDFTVIPILLFGPPIALLVFGIAAGWAFRGFKADDLPKAS
jgi:hypothetical protein